MISKAFSSLGRLANITIEVSRERGPAYLLGFGVRGYCDAALVSYNHLYSRAYARLFRKPLIHVIGDSHSWAFKRSRLFIIHNIGPATAYNLASEHSSVGSNEKLFRVIGRIDRSRDIVIMVFGEIDCRVHIYNQFKKSGEKIPITDLIDHAIANYGSVLRQLNDMGVRFCVYGVLPASPEVIRFPPYATPRMKAAEESEFRRRYPYLADIGTRSLINREFNERLRSYCLRQGYGYIDIHSLVSGPDGVTAPEYVADEIHVNGKIMGFIRRWLENEYGLTF